MFSYILCFQSNSEHTMLKICSEYTTDQSFGYFFFFFLEAHVYLYSEKML